MVPNSVVALPLVVILTTAGPALAATSMIAEDSSMVTGWRAETVAPTGDEAGWACLLEGTGRAERDDRAAGREGRGEQRRADDRARPAAAAGPLGGHVRGRGRRRGLVPAFLRGLVGLARPGGALGPIGPGLGRGGVAAGLAGGRRQRVALRLVRRVVRLVGVGVLRIAHGVVMISGSGAVPRTAGWLPRRLGAVVV